MWKLLRLIFCEIELYFILKSAYLSQSLRFPHVTVPFGGRFPMRRRSACTKSVAYFRAFKHHPRPEVHSNEHIQKFQVPDATMTRRFCHLATPPATAAAGLRPFGEMSEFEAVCLAIAKIAFKCRHCCRFGSPFSSGIPGKSPRLKTIESESVICNCLRRRRWSPGCKAPGSLGPTPDSRHPTL